MNLDEVVKKKSTKDMILDANNPLFEVGVLLENNIERRERIWRVEERRRIFANFLPLLLQDRGVFIDQSTRL